MSNIDNDPAVVTARQAAVRRAELADTADALLRIIGMTRIDVPVPTDNPDALVALAGELATLTRAVEQSRDLVVQIARLLPEGRRPSWAQLAAAMHEPDRNNLARRYRGRVSGGDR